MKRYILFRLAIITNILTHVNLSTDLLDGEAVLHVTPSSSVPCPVKHCITLSHFAQTSKSWLLFNITLIFLAGNHQLNTEVSISDISNFFMLTKYTSESEGLAYTIWCQHKASFNFENVTNLWIKGINFIGCGNNRFLSVKNFTINNCTFQGQNDSGTALNITESNLIATNTIFVSNRVGNRADIVDRNTSNHTSVYVGGTIFLAKGNLAIVGCIFLNNSAEVGGAIYSTSYELNDISIRNSTFVHNRAAFHDSNQSVSNLGRIRIPKSVGGSIAIFNTTLSINSGTFTNNTSEDGEGGAISIQQNSTVSIHDSIFYGNEANTYGGSFFIRESSVYINNSIFLQNCATQGGVMYSTQSSVIALTGSIYKGSSAQQSGGAIFTDQGTWLYGNHSLFVNNRATTGGALYAIESNMDFNDIVFSYNQARESGGAIYVLQSQQEVAFSGRCNLTHNSASTAGGALYAIESILSIYGGDILYSKHFYELRVAFNEVNDSGGGIYLSYSTLVSRQLGSIATILSNSAKSKGGGVFATKSLITYTEPYHAANNTPHQNLLVFTNNSAQLGGGLYLTSAAQLRIQKTGSHLNPYHLKLNTSIYFMSNFAQNGTAIYVDDETYPDICEGGYNMRKGGDISGNQCFVRVFREDLL